MLTAADFRLDDDASALARCSIRSPTNTIAPCAQKHKQNIISVTEALPDHANLAPHLGNRGALWLRSIAVGNLAGPIGPHCRDITRSKPV